MKKLFLLAFISVFLFNCKQEQRYTQKSKEIDALKAIIDAYDNKDWPTMLSHYADTSKTRFNNLKMDSKDVPKFHKDADNNYASRGFSDKGQVYEMVTDDEGKTWVNFWGDWKCTLKGNNKELGIPVHITARFVDGKIVEDYGYWDPSEIISNLQEMAAKKESMTGEE